MEVESLLAKTILLIVGESQGVETIRDWYQLLYI